MEPKIVTEGGATFLHFDEYTVIVRPRIAASRPDGVAGAMITVVCERETETDDYSEVVASAYFTSGASHHPVTEVVKNDVAWLADVARHTLRGRS